MLAVEVIRCYTRGESEECIGEEAHKYGIHPGFDTQGRHHQKSKTGISGPTKRTDVTSKLFRKRIHTITKQESLLFSNMCTQWYTPML